MRVTVFVKATAEGETGALLPFDLMEAMGRINADLAPARTLQGHGEGLKPSSPAVRVRFDGADRSVSNGTFGPPESLVAGCWIWRVADMAEVIASARRCPNPMPGPSDIEIPPIYELADLAQLLGGGAQLATCA
ncbi:MAG: YciI family protein [Sphingomonadaceae bacterium]|nr:YciI family protein [Sphingomonadaceae bacterium]